MSSGALASLLIEHWVPVVPWVIHGKYWHIKADRCLDIRLSCSMIASSCFLLNDDRKTWNLTPGDISFSNKAHGKASGTARALTVKPASKSMKYFDRTMTASHLNDINASCRRSCNFRWKPTTRAVEELPFYISLCSSIKMHLIDATCPLRDPSIVVGPLSQEPYHTASTSYSKLLACAGLTKVESHKRLDSTWFALDPQRRKPHLVFVASLRSQN